MTKRFCYFYGIFPGNDVMQTELLKYCPLIGYCHGGREIYKVELWESIVWKDSSILLCVAKYHLFSWPKRACVHADFPRMDSKQTVVCCYHRRSPQWRKEACLMGIVCECTERRITWDTTTIAPQDSFQMEGAEYRITLRRFPVSRFAIICCITLQFPFNITFALCSRQDNYLNEAFLNAAKVRTS